jgi:hypothetical protein
MPLLISKARRVNSECSCFGLEAIGDLCSNGSLNPPLKPAALRLKSDSTVAANSKVRSRTSLIIIDGSWTGIGGFSKKDHLMPTEEKVRQRLEVHFNSR